MSAPDDDFETLLQKSLDAARARRLSIVRAPTRTHTSRLNDSIEATVKVADLEKRDRPGKHVEHVYCIRFGDGPVKFGLSSNVGARIRVLGASHWQSITMLGAVMGGREVERSVHQAMTPFRIDGSSEWYRPTDPVLALATAIVKRTPMTPEVQASIDLYAPVPIEHVYAGTKGYGVCPCCGRGHT